MFHELTDPGQVAELTPEDCLDAYAFTKRATQAAARRDIADLADGMAADSSRHAHRRNWRTLKNTEPTW